MLNDLVGEPLLNKMKFKMIRSSVDGLDCYQVSYKGVAVGYVRQNDKRRWGVRGLSLEDFIYDFDTRQDAALALVNAR